jgi:hypothetical protein
LEDSGVKKLEGYLPLFLKFIRTFVKEFPYPQSNESIQDIMDNIKNFDYGRFHDKELNVFNNNTSTVGVTYLKSIFKSFWGSSFKGNETPIEIWDNDNKMIKIIAYRIGLNNSGEIYDFSLRNLLKGMSAIRGTVSFFKPLVAAGIYKHYIGEKDNPVVFDPCCGFGGRLLGFKSVYPNGTYIGCEPNIKTYNELLLLSEGFTNIKVYNCKLEDLNHKIEYDFGFTSIPYFDLEDYKNGVEYKSFDEWREKFITPLLSYENMVINMSNELCELLELNTYIDGYLSNSKTHFRKSDKKSEVLIKL